MKLLPEVVDVLGIKASLWIVLLKSMKNLTGRYALL
jgi:hypothetical protein